MLPKRKVSLADDGFALNREGPRPANPPSLVSSGIGLARNAASLGLAQGVSRLCSVLLIAYVARTLGVEALGRLALGLTIATYVRTAMDLGMPMIGARLIAARAESAPSVANVIQSRRLKTAAVAVALGAAYAWYGPVPPSARGVSLVFVLAVIPWAFSFEWLVWGLERFDVQALSQSSISVAHLAISILLLVVLGPHLVYVACAYGAGMLIATLFLRAFWAREKAGRLPAAPAHVLGEIQSAASWSEVGTLGIALLLNQVFRTVDVMLMGALSTPEQLGLYSAGMKIIVVIYGAFYVATQAAYPMLARIKRTPSVNRIVIGVLAAVAIAGCAIAGGLGLFAKQLLVLVYGSRLAGASASFKILLAALPLEFLTASLSTVLISDGRNRSITIAIGSGALTSVIANLLLIPRYGATGAALANVASYGVFFVALAILLFVDSNSEAHAAAETAA